MGLPAWKKNLLEDGQRSRRRRRGAQEGTLEGRRRVGWCSVFGGQVRGQVRCRPRVGQTARAHGLTWAQMDCCQCKRVSGPFGPRLLINFHHIIQSPKRISLSKKVQREFSCQEMLVAPVGNIAGNVNPGCLNFHALSMALLVVALPCV
jgi:hypothetical protein